MQTAENRLERAVRLLDGDQGTGRLVALQRKLVGRRCRMVTTLAAAYELSFRTGARYVVPHHTAWQE